MSTAISWTDETWNCVTGCSRVSGGCVNCYAAALAPRLAAMGQKGYTNLSWTKANAPENVFLHPDRLEKPLRWKKPRRVFVNSMSDLFHERIPDEFIDRVFAVMALAPRHTFQILTKRPQRMAEYLGRERHQWVMIEGQAQNIVEERTGRDPSMLSVKLPLPNVWCGTSVEDQRAADERIPPLLRTPAAVRFLSCEPLLDHVSLVDIEHPGGNDPYDALGHPDPAFDSHIKPELHGGIQWVIAGGESGPNHRLLDHAWMRLLRDQCQAAGVAFFAKQDAGPRNEMPLPADLQIREFPEAST